ncbi:MAG: DnaJ domain-containing protein [Oscillospiraceae bacterium]|nr:DnaJ domain-containing protein [Oscillospiraceae bacterium]
MDAYKILGLSYGASEEEIKKRYRALVKEYHPDLHPGDEQAARKMSEINEAYEQIRSGSAETFADASSAAPHGTYTDGDTTYYYQYKDISEIIREMFGMKGRGAIANYEFIEMYIENGAYERAARLLDITPRDNARWYYYAAQVYEHTGDLGRAESFAKTAVNMEPSENRYVLYWESLVIEREYTERALIRSRFWRKTVAVLIIILTLIYFLRPLFYLF